MSNSLVKRKCRRVIMQKAQGNSHTSAKTTYEIHKGGVVA